MRALEKLREYLPRRFRGDQPVVPVVRLTGIIGFWATLSLNIPDFTRYARSQRDQVLGQALGLPLTMALYSFIGVAVTSATKVIFCASRRRTMGSPRSRPCATASR